MPGAEMGPLRIGKPFGSGSPSDREALRIGKLVGSGSSSDFAAARVWIQTYLDPRVSGCCCIWMRVDGAGARAPERDRSPIGRADVLEGRFRDPASASSPSSKDRGVFLRNGPPDRSAEAGRRSDATGYERSGDSRASFRPIEFAGIGFRWRSESSGARAATDDDRGRRRSRANSRTSVRSAYAVRGSSQRR
jgi:hypothetical protein